MSFHTGIGPGAGPTTGSPTDKGLVLPCKCDVTPLLSHLQSIQAKLDTVINAVKKDSGSAAPSVGAVHQSPVVPTSGAVTTPAAIKRKGICDRLKTALILTGHVASDGPSLNKIGSTSLGGYYDMPVVLYYQLRDYGSYIPDLWEDLHPSTIYLDIAGGYYWAQLLRNQTKIRSFLDSCGIKPLFPQ